ncbi:MAG: tetratricopeptide repeat protein [Rikenellaceae bacterium]|nr:tetratricopeptide repeat protein [Rikenellaceae bacterium]
MKRTLLMVAAMFVMAAPVANAQIDTSLGFADIQDVNVEKVRAGLKKQDAAVADAKKAAKAATWVKRGQAYYNAANDPTAGVFAGLNETVLLNTVGSKVAEAGEDVVVNGAKLRKYTCDNFDAYCQGGQIVFVVATTVIDPNALQVAYDSYNKAYELSPKVEKKVNEGMTNIMNKHIFNAQGHYGIGKLTEAASEFFNAYKVSCHPSVNHPDTVDVYNAAVMATVGGDFKNGLTYVDEAIKLNYMEGGETYYYKSVCLYNLDRKDEAKEVLKEGITMYPTNNNIIETLLQYYNEDENSNPRDIIPMVRRAIAKDPSNANLHLGMGRIHAKLGELDNAIASMQTAVQLNPADFYANFYLGDTYLEQASLLEGDLNRLPFPTTADAKAAYDQALKLVNDKFAASVVPFETAYGLNPKEIATVERLKNVTFRLRETSPEMKAKYEKFNDLYNSMRQ